MKNPTILIGGGYDKGSSFDEWIVSFNSKVKTLVLMGETKRKNCCIQQENMVLIILLWLIDLKEAVLVSAKKARKVMGTFISCLCQLGNV